MSIKIVAQLHPFKTDLTILDRNTAPLSELYTDLGVQADIRNARMMIDDRKVTDFTETPEDGSTVYIKVVPAGSNKQAGKGMGWVGGLMIAAGAALVWYGPTSGLGVALIGSGIGLLSGGVVLYNTQIPKIGGNSDHEAVEQSPSIRGARNQKAQWGVVPMLLGRHLIYPFYASDPYTSVAGDMAGNLAGDAVNNDQYLTQLYCAGYNNMTIDFSTVKIGDSKITDLSYTKNINNIRNGTDPWIWLEVIQNGSNSAIYPKVCKESLVNLLVEHAQPITRTTVEKTTKIIVDLRLPSGLGKYNKKGKLVGTELDYKVEYKPAGHPDSEYSYITKSAPFTPGPQHITDNRLRTIQWRLEQTVTAGQYDVRVTRITADSTDANTIDQIQWISLKSIREERPVHAERASQLTIIALKVKATNLIQGYVDQLNFVAQSVLPVYSGSGSGASSWATSAATSNPAACFKYALQGAINTDPLANNNIDWKGLEDWYQWCAVHNYTCNAYITEEITLRQLLYQIASTARAEFTKVNNKVGVVMDVARSSHVQLFTPRNSKNFEATRLFADIPQAMDMQFINAGAGYIDDQRTVYDVTGGYGDGTGGTTEAKKKQTVKLWGVTNPAQAYLIGKYMYAVTYLRPWIYSFTVDMEYLLAGRGSLVRLSHDVAMSGQAWGRINSRILEDGVVTGFVLDELVTMEAGNSYVIRIRKKDNSTILLPVATIEGTSGEVHLNTSMLASSAPDTGDLFAFGLSGQETTDILITKIEPLDDMQARITAVDYSPEIFGVDDPDYVIPPYNPNITVGGILDDGISKLTPVERELERRIMQRPTYEELGSGFIGGGLSETPDIPVLTCKGMFRAIVVEWPLQHTLSNLDYYKVQVSDDGNTWYKPRLDGVDWKYDDAEENFFRSISNIFVHANIMPITVDDVSVGRTLYYRVSAVTKKELESGWSDPESGTTLLTQTEDYAYHSITANAIAVGALNAMIARINAYLTVDPNNGYQAGLTASEGDERAYLNNVKIAFEKRINGIWKTMVQMAATGVLTKQLYSDGSLFITNQPIADRRAAGMDIGVPYLSTASEVYHFDTDFKNQHQQTSISLRQGDGEEYQLVDGSYHYSGSAAISFIPPLEGVAPYSTEGKSLFGNVEIYKNLGNVSKFTIDFWYQHIWQENQIIFDIGCNGEWIMMQVENEEPYYNEPAEGEPSYNEAVDAETELVYNQIGAAHVNILHGNQYAIYTEKRQLTNFNEGWYHMAIVMDANHISLFLNGSEIQFNRFTSGSQAMEMSINPGKVLVSLDELMIDTTVAESLELFIKNSGDKVPWGALDYEDEWLAIMANDPTKVRSNCFYRKDEIDTKLSDVYTKAQVNTKLSDGSVTKVANESINSAALSGHLDNGGNLVNPAVTTHKIANGAITNIKLAQGIRMDRLYSYGWQKTGTASVAGGSFNIDYGPTNDRPIGSIPFWLIIDSTSYAKFTGSEMLADGVWRYKFSSTDEYIKGSATIRVFFYL